MNITRYFLKTEDSQGHKGFVPLWIPSSANFVVVTPLGLLHDCLEHGLSDTGTGGRQGSAAQAAKQQEQLI